jgi:hypothetical protein
MDERGTSISEPQKSLQYQRSHEASNYLARLTLGMDGT